MAHSRNKGAAAEREFAAAIFEQLGVQMVRNLEQYRNGGCDLIVEDPDHPAAHALDCYAIEIKRQEKATPSIIKNWWTQALEQANRSGKYPCLAYRQSRTPWKVMVPLFVINPDLTRCTDITWTAVMGVNAFCCVVREAIQ